MTLERSRALTWLVLSAVFLTGFAALALLPPWEGADETAHWSYIQELSDTGHQPSGGDGMSQDVDRYAGPRPYANAAPFEQTGSLTYRRAHDNRSGWSESRPGRFSSGPTLNWEAQHPPLYYAALIPLYRAVHALPFRDHLFCLRLASWMLAFGGLAIGVLATAYAAPDWARGHAPLMAAWPFMAPQFFPALARLGNDSLCLLEAGVIWLLLLRLTERQARPLTVLALGATLGLGMLTKAFFLPIGAGVAAYLVFAGWRGKTTSRSLVAALVVIVVAAAIGGWWYVGQYHLTHDITGGGDFVALRLQGGLAAGLNKHYSLFAILRGLAALAATFVWTGTWSLARPPEIFILGPLLLVAIPIVLWFKRLPKSPTLAWAPLFLTAPMLASLVYHVIAFVALTGRGASTPGYYLHVLAAPLAFAVALGWRKGLLLPALWIYTGLFTLAVSLLEASMFSGCAAKLGDDPHFTFAGADCLIDLRQLQQLAHPIWAVVVVGAALVLLGAALLLAKPGLEGLASPREMEPTPL